MKLRLSAASIRPRWMALPRSLMYQAFWGVPVRPAVLSAAEAPSTRLRMTTASERLTGLFGRILPSTPLSRPISTAVFSASSAQCPAMSGNAGSAGSSGCSGCSGSVGSDGVSVSTGVRVTGSSPATMAAVSSRASSPVKGPASVQGSPAGRRRSDWRHPRRPARHTAYTRRPRHPPFRRAFPVPASVRVNCTWYVSSSLRPASAVSMSALVSQTSSAASAMRSAFVWARKSATPVASAPAGSVTTTLCRSSGKSTEASARSSCAKRCVSTARTDSTTASLHAVGAERLRKGGREGQHGFTGGFCRNGGLSGGVCRAAARGERRGHQHHSGQQAAQNTFFQGEDPSLLNIIIL